MMPSFFELTMDANFYTDLKKMLKDISDHVIEYNKSHDNKTNVKIWNYSYIPKDKIFYVCAKTNKMWSIDVGNCKGTLGENLVMNKQALYIAKNQKG